MNTLEVLTLVLVIFTALAYLDNHQTETNLLITSKYIIPKVLVFYKYLFGLYHIFR